MAGAYTAKPKADTTPDVPPGWNVNWTFPGVYPPGYIPDLSLVGTGPAAIAPAGTAFDVKFTLTDHGTYVTSEPSGDAVVITAVMDSDDSVANMKFSGGSEFFGSLSASYEDVGSSFFGSLSDIVFDTDVSDLGDTIVVTATSSPLGQSEITQTIEIPVVAAAIRIEMTATVSGDETYTQIPWPRSYFFSGTLLLSRFIPGALPWWPPTELEAYAQVVFYSAGDPFNPDTSCGDFTGVNPNATEMLPTAVCAELALTMDVNETVDTTYYLSVDQQHTRIDECDINVTIKTYRGETLVGNETFSRTNDTASYTYTTKFATIDGGTGEITMLDPPVTTRV